jgi:hypothetical protein
MYYNAVSKKQMGKLPLTPPQAASEQYLERAAPTDTQGDHLEPSPVSGAAALLPSSLRPRVWNAVNRYKSAPSFLLPKSENEPAADRSPPPILDGDRLSSGGSVYPDKSLLAAAIRSKLLRQSASIRQKRDEHSRDYAIASALSTNTDSFVSENEAQPSELPSESIELDEIELQLPAPGVEMSIDPLMNGFKLDCAGSLDCVDDTFSAIAEVESISEDSSIWRAREQPDDDSVDVHSTASSITAVASVFSALTESQVITVESEISSEEREHVSWASHNSINHEF